MAAPPQDISNALAQASRDYGVDYQTLSSFAQIESGYNPGAVSPTGVGGLFQITRATWSSYSNEPYSLDPYKQAAVASQVLSDLQNRYHGDMTLVAVGYNAGTGVADKLLGKPFNADTVRDAVLSTRWPSSVNALQKVQEVLNYPQRLGSAMGTSGDPTGGVGRSSRQVSAVSVAPNDVDAARNFAIPLAADVSQATPITPVQVIQEGLDLALWWQKDPTQAGGLIQNPHLRGVPCPAWFELRLNKVDGTSLAGRDGSPLTIRLNASLQSINTKMQHIISREPTATGLMISMWGSQPDTIVGRGTTGAFLNQFGLTALMSNRLTAKSADWYSLISMAITDPLVRQKLLGNGDAQNVFRVAAQDAFAELLALFKNNGVIRFLPKTWAESYLSRHTGASEATSSTNLRAAEMLNTSASGGMQVWSPAAGATGFQMLARAGDVYTRGHVVFKYKGKSYFGYFKSFNFTASADTPFRWDFDFTFRVLKSFDPIFVSTSHG